MATGNRYEPYQVVDPDGVVMDGAAQFFRDLLAAGKAESTVRSYGTDLLRWFRFCWAVRVDWDRATRTEARDFSRWLQVAGKQSRPHWRAGPLAAVSVGAAGGEAYAPSVRAHSETVLRSFYGFHLDAGTGPVINPFPLDRSRRHGRAHAHHNPMEPYRNERSGLYRPKVPSRVPRSIPDGEFNEIFARLPSHRDRALVAFYVSTGARASELLSATVAGTDPGRQVITVVLGADLQGSLAGRAAGSRPETPAAHGTLSRDHRQDGAGAAGGGLAGRRRQQVGRRRRPGNEALDLSRQAGETPD